MPGTVISPVEIVQVSSFGIWLAVEDEELFLDYAHFPWFMNTTISSICAVEMPAKGHLYWPALDIDLDIESIRHPDAYPLVAK
jgi:hypothetical protein